MKSLSSLDSLDSLTSLNSIDSGGSHSEKDSENNTEISSTLLNELLNDKVNVKEEDPKEEDFKEEDSDWESISNSTGSIKSINSDYSFSSVEELYDTWKYVYIEDFPVQVMMIEKFEDTLDNLIENGYSISDTEWKSILFQICFGLAVSQKHYKYVHNDLHSSNIMFQETENEYLYYKYKNKYYRIPTFNKITKIIDFGRATFEYDNKIFFSDVFKKHGDAEGQYSFPYNNSLKTCKIKPNFSFDLSRLATTIIQHFREGSNLFNLLKLWCMDKYGNCLLYNDDDFNLYKNIAKNVHSAVPCKQIEKKIFRDFIIKRSEIEEGTLIYNLH